MFKRTTIISGLVSATLLVAASFTTSAKASEFPLDAARGIVDLLLDETKPRYVEAGYNDNWSRDYGYDNYDRLPIRRITRKLRRRGLYPVSDFRLRRGRIIVRAENDRGARFRVVANARSGNIIKLTRLRGNRRWQPVPSNDWGDYRGPYYDDNWSAQRPRYRNNRLERKAKKRARTIRRENRNRVVRHPRRDIRTYDKPRRSVRPSHIKKRRGHSKVYQSSEDYRMWKYGSGK